MRTELLLNSGSTAVVSVRAPRVQQYISTTVTSFLAVCTYGTRYEHVRGVILVLIVCILQAGLRRDGLTLAWAPRMPAMTEDVGKSRP